MTDTVDKSIDEILRYFRGWVSLAGNSGEPMYKLGEYEQGELDEAKQAIKALIDQAVVEARLDSLDRFSKDFNNYASEYRELFNPDVVGIVWGLLAKQQIPLAELEDKL